MKKWKKIATAKLYGFEVIYFELHDTFNRDFLGKEEKVIFKNKEELFEEWKESEELNIFNNEFNIKYLQFTFGEKKCNIANTSLK